MPGEVTLVDLVKRFGDVAAVAGINLEMPSGEFFSMLGPSGCGKTTTLRMIAGFEQPTEGRILLDGEDMAYTPPHKRNVNTVFQNYALFPHLNVADNVAFGLRRQKVGKQELRQRVGEALELVQLTGFEKRKPGQMSGGQQQRVALARALVLKPAVLLLDEPLGALDAKLRKALQVELKALQQQVGITFVYVTHDQEEALTMSDRIAVMADGRVEQVGPAAGGLRGARDGVRGRLPRASQPDGRRGGGRRQHLPADGGRLRARRDARQDRRARADQGHDPARARAAGGVRRAAAPTASRAWSSGWSTWATAVQVITRLAIGTTIQVLVQNVGTEIPWKQGTPVQAYLPPEALRVLTDTGAALAPLDEEAVAPG